MGDLYSLLNDPSFDASKQFAPVSATDSQKALQNDQYSYAQTNPYPGSDGVAPADNYSDWQQNAGGAPAPQTAGPDPAQNPGGMQAPGGIPTPTSGGVDPKVQQPPPSGQTPPPNTPPPQPNQPPAGTSPTGARLSLYGHDMNTQARMLTDWLAKYGVDTSKMKMTVGGQSPYDTQINSMIDKINDPNTPESGLNQIAQDLAGLINLRNNSVNATQDYGNMVNFQNGQIQQPEGRDMNDLISKLYNPNNPTGGIQLQKNTIMSGGNQDVLANLLKELGTNGGVNPEQRRLMESQMIDSAEQSGASKRSEIADSLAANGIQGGAMVDALDQAKLATNQQRVSGTRDLLSHILDQQLASKNNAMGGLLQQQGMDAANSQLLARLVQEAQQSQVSAGLSLQQNQLGERGQNLNYLAHLLDLASAGDEDAKARALQMLNGLGLNQDVQQ